MRWETENEVRETFRGGNRERGNERVSDRVLRWDWRAREKLSEREREWERGRKGGDE